MFYVLEFLAFFIIVFVLYYFLVIRKAKKMNEKKLPIEISYLVARHKLDVKKIGFKKLYRITAIISSFDIAVTAVIVLLVKGIILQMIIGLLLLIPLIIFSYEILGRYYVKKGMIKNV